MIAGMPVKSNKYNIIHCLNKLFSPNTMQRAYYKFQVRQEVIYAVQNGWLPSGFNTHVDYVINSAACIRSCESNGKPEALVDWVCGNYSLGHVASHLAYIELSHNRIQACRKRTLSYIVDTMNGDPAFDPPYTDQQGEVYEMLFG